MSTAPLNSIYNEIVLIDDDCVQNMIAEQVLKKFVDVAVVRIKPFDDPKEGLTYLLNQNPEHALKVLVFLDINMPVLSGWDVLDKLTELDEKITENMRLYILTSSIDPRDKARAASYPLVSGFLSKPLLPHLENIFT